MTFGAPCISLGLSLRHNCLMITFGSLNRAFNTIKAFKTLNRFINSFRNPIGLSEYSAALKKIKKKNHTDKCTIKRKSKKGYSCYTAVKTKAF